MANEGRAPIEIRARWLQVTVWAVGTLAGWVALMVALFHEPIARAAGSGIFFVILSGAFLLIQQRWAARRSDSTA